MSGLPSAKIYLERGDTKIAIETEKVDEAVSNKFIKIVLPKVGSSQATQVNTTKFKDLKKIEFNYTVEDFIKTQQSTDAAEAFYDAQVQYDGANVRLTAAQAKNTLIYKIIYGSDKVDGEPNFYWGGLAKSTVAPDSALADLMELDDEARVTTAAIELVRFEETARTRSYFKYLQSDGYTVDTSEYSPKRYGFTIRLTKAVSF